MRQAILVVLRRVWCLTFHRHQMLRLVTPWRSGHGTVTHHCYRCMRYR